MPLDPKIQEAFNEIAEYQRQHIEEEINGLRAILHQCESPLEQKLLLHFIQLHIQGLNIHFYGKPQISIDWYTDNPNPKQAEKITECRILIEPQYPIELSNKTYRADLRFTVRVHLTPGGYDTEIAELIVEVDGHEYHERTKEQARHDKERDRLLQQAGYTVFRFTGSEIYHDPDPAVDSIKQFLDSRSVMALIHYQKHPET